jgi:hypothetical protein
MLCLGGQAELREMEPRLVATEKEVDEMIVRIDADKASAADTKVRGCGSWATGGRAVAVLNL